MTDRAALAARLDGMTYRCPVADAARELADVAADELAAVVLDPDSPWWRRRLCAAALHRRVPDDHADALLAVLVDESETTEVRTALADVLATAAGPVTGPLLAWLAAQVNRRHPHQLDLAVLRARAALGDTGAIGPLVRMAAGDWWFQREGATAVLDDVGVEATLAALGAGSVDELVDPDRRPDEDVRLLGVRLLGETGGDPSPALADPSRVVARAAYDALAVRDHRPGGPVDRMAADPVPAAVAAPRVVLPAVPADVRAAVVRHYAPGERRTDPRWLVEMAFAEPTVVDEDGQLQQVRAALDAAGLTPGDPVSAGDQYAQGEGTYHQITTAAGPVEVSALGPFFLADDDRIVEALRAAGLRPVDRELATTVVDGLCVYFFGDRDPLPVGDLLFYWQD